MPMPSPANISGGWTSSRIGPQNGTSAGRPSGIPIMAP